ncbi:MAG TPA: TIGR03435 family protein [Bryobacteraceae bacterium]|nr:TIGR03435 family protein [Bryobacteraceae bacterium]
MHVDWVISSLLCASLSITCAQSGGGRAFDVASIKPANLSLDPGPGKRLQYTPGGMKIYSVTVSRLIREAYRVPETLIVGAPTWSLNDQFDVVAKAAGPADKGQLQLMLRKLLADRCHLAVHCEPKEMPFYELTIRDRTKLYPVAADTAITAKDLEALGANRPLNNRERLAAAGGAGAMSCRCTLQELAARLTENSREIGHPVIDKTGLDGTYLFLPQYYAGELITVLDTQYGVKLLSKKGPVDTLVIDKVERPSGN